jgi:flavodoxin
MKPIIIYYSYGGNTKGIMNQVKAKLNIPMLALEPVKAYTSNYDELVKEMQRPDNPDLDPLIKSLSIDLNLYDTIILGTPVWWYTISGPVRTFLKQNDLSHKVIMPIATNAGWIGHTFKEIESLTQAQVVNELNLVFNGEMLTNQNDLNKWLENVNNKMKEKI